MDYAKVKFSDEDLGLLDVPSDESLKYIGGDRTRGQAVPWFRV
jgi:hypothetical protein